MCVVIVDNPDRPPYEDNIKGIGFNGPERCQHLRGDTPGKFSCAVHDKPWYPDTPCFEYGQIEQSPDDVCRMGEYILGRVVKLTDTLDLKSCGEIREGLNPSVATKEK